MNTEEVKTIKIKRVAKAGHFGINSYPKSVTTLGCEMGKDGFKTGLTKEEEAFYEEKLSLKPGTLNKHSDWWSKTFNTEYPIRLFNTKTTTLNLGDVINQLKFKALSQSSKIASSEIEVAKNPGVLFYIDNEEAKAKAELEHFNYEFEAMKIILSLSPDEKRSSLRLFGKTGIDSLSENMLNAHLMNESKKDPKRFIDTLTDKNVKTKGLIKELVEKGILLRKGNYFIHGEDTIAHSLEECALYLDNPNNQSVRLILESRLNKSNKKASK